MPVKLHGNAQSIIRTMLKPIRLDIYLSANRLYAHGLLYLDDGETFRYQTKKEKALIKYTFSEGMKLTCDSLLDTSY